MSLDSYEVTGPGFEEIDNMIILVEESSIQFRKKKKTDFKYQCFLRI